MEQKYHLLKPPTEEWNTGPAIWDDMAKNKFWIAHRERFITTAFALITGQHPMPAAGGNALDACAQQEVA